MLSALYLRHNIGPPEYHDFDFSTYFLPTESFSRSRKDEVSSLPGDSLLLVPGRHPPAMQMFAAAIPIKKDLGNSHVYGILQRNHWHCTYVVYEFLPSLQHALMISVVRR